MHKPSKPYGRFYGGHDEREKLIMKGFTPEQKNILFSQCVEDDEGCWNYQGGDYVELSGLTFNPRRLAYRMTKGTVNTYDMVSCRCHNLQCCNPQHLFKIEGRE